MGFDKSSVETKTDPARRLRVLADKACRERGFDGGAEESLIAAIEADVELTHYAVRVAAHSEIRLAMMVRRQHIAGVVETIEDKKSTGSPKKYAKEICDRVSEWGGKYLAWPLSNRKLLGEATLDDVRAEAEMYEANAQGNARNGRFMRLVEKRLVTMKVKPGEMVGAVLNDSILERLMAKAQTE